MPLTIGQTPDRKTDKQRLPFRTEADIGGGRGGLSCEYCGKKCACRAKSERRNIVIAGKVQERIGQVKKVLGK
jgi:hypothetical protein